MAEEVVCYICHDGFGRGAEIGELDCCSHAFCFGCISKWSAIENTCPCCKLRFAAITRKALGATPGRGAAPAGARLPGRVLDVQRCEETNQRPVFEDPSFQDYIESVVCLVCGGNHAEEQLLLCDDCDAAAHTFCAGLDAIPEGDWFCGACSHRREEEQRRRRRQLEERAARAAARRQRKRRRTLIASEDDEEEEMGGGDGSEEDGGILEIVEVRAGRARGRLQRGGGGGGGGLGGRRRGGADDMADFIVPTDEDDDSDGSLEEEEELEAAAGRGRGQVGGGRRRRGQPAAALDSDFEEEEEEWADWGSDEEEKAPRRRPQRPQRQRQQAPATDGGWRQARRDVAPARGQSRGSRLAAAAVAAPSRGRAARQQEQRAAAETAAAPSAAHRAVQALADSWEALRAGTSTFQDVLSSGGGGGGGGGAQQPRRQQRSALDRVRASESEVIDLSVSPADAAAAQRGSGDGGGDAGRVPFSPPLLSLSAKLRADLQACRDRGARLPQSRGGASGSAGAGPAAAPPAPAVTPRPAAGAPGASPWRVNTSPGGSGRRLRTVRDLQRGAELARGTPASGGRTGGGGATGAPGSSGPFRPPRPAVARVINDGRSSPPPLRERLAARTAAEWGARPGGGAAPGSGVVAQQGLPLPSLARQAPQPGPWRQVHRPESQQAQQAAAPVPSSVPLPARADIPVFMRRAMAAGAGGAGPSAPQQQQQQPGGGAQSPAYSPPKPQLGSSGGSGGSAATHAAAPVAGPNPKQAAYDRVRRHLDPLLEEGDISRGQYKAVARDASRALYRRHGGGAGAAPEAEVGRLVDEALVAAIRAGAGGRD